MICTGAIENKRAPARKGSAAKYPGADLCKCIDSSSQHFYFFILQEKEENEYYMGAASSLFLMASLSVVIYFLC